jgi:CelD/BcsL family acetyltransferase involved in cellulose biosynthesis
MNAVRVSVATDAGAFGEPGWDRLAIEAGTVFHTSGFLSSWWSDTAVRQPGSELVVVRVDEASNHIGQCAFELREGELRFAGGGDVVDYMGPIAASGFETEVVEALVDLISTRLVWRSARFEGLVADDPLTRLLIEEFGRRGHPVVSRYYDQAPRIRPGPTPYLARLNAKRRKEVLRKRTRLSEAVGTVSVAASTEADRSAALDRLLAWKGEATSQTREFVARYGEFLTNLVTRLGATGQAHVVELVGGDRPLASAIVFTFRGVHYLYNMSYDLRWLGEAPTGLAPGVVLVSHLAEQAVDEDTEFDFLKGGQDYKLQLGGVPEDLVRLEVSR